MLIVAHLKSAMSYSEVMDLIHRSSHAQRDLHVFDESALTGEVTALTGDKTEVA